MTIRVLYINGVGEGQYRQPVQLDALVQRLDTSIFTVEHFPWFVEYGVVPNWDGDSYRKSIRDGSVAVREFIDDEPPDDKFVLVGYSGGAHIAGDVADNHPRVIGCALVADPMRPKMHWPAGHGILGQREVHGCWFWEVANPHDVITSCPAGSPLRTFGDVTSTFSVSDSVVWPHLLLQTVFQRWWEEPFTDWSGVINSITGYMLPYPFGQHTGYDHMIMPGTQVTYLDWLANELNTWDKWDESPQI